MPNELLAAMAFMTCAVLAMGGQTAALNGDDVEPYIGGIAFAALYGAVALVLG